METVKDKVLQIASEIFYVDKSALTEETNLQTLSVLRVFLGQKSHNEPQDLIVSKEGLKVDILEVNRKSKGRKLELDISTLFVGCNTIKYHDELGSDGFCEFHLIPVLFVLELESTLKVEIKDEEAGRFETLGDVIISIKSKK